MEGKTVTRALWGIPTHSFYARVDMRGFSSSRGSEAPGQSGSRAEWFVSSGRVRLRVGSDGFACLMHVRCRVRTRLTSQ